MSQIFTPTLLSSILGDLHFKVFLLSKPLLWIPTGFQRSLIGFHQGTLFGPFIWMPLLLYSTRFLSSCFLQETVSFLNIHLQGRVGWGEMYMSRDFSHPLFHSLCIHRGQGRARQEPGTGSFLLVLPHRRGPSASGFSALGKSRIRSGAARVRTSNHTGWHHCKPDPQKIVSDKLLPPLILPSDAD